MAGNREQAVQALEKARAIKKLKGITAKGTKQKSTQIVQHVFSVYHALGGDKGLLEWALKNRSAFYLSMYAKFIPKNIQIDRPTIDEAVNGLVTYLEQSHGLTIDRDGLRQAISESISSGKSPGVETGTVH